MASTCPIGPSGTRCKTLATAPTRCAEQLQAQLRLRRAIPAITSIPMRWPHSSAAVRRAVTALPERQFGKWHAGFFVKEHTPLYRGFNSSYGFLTGKAPHLHLQPSVLRVSLHLHLQSTLPPRPLVTATGTCSGQNRNVLRTREQLRLFFSAGGEDHYSEATICGAPVCGEHRKSIDIWDTDRPALTKNGTWSAQLFAEVQKRCFLVHSYSSFYQDRLGTKIGKALKTTRRLSRLRRR